jgi:aromatic ring-opening dioxygenase catalytic subunit (LigB family)
LEIVHGLIEEDVDVGAAAKVDDPHKAGFGHAYGFIIERLFKDKKIPVVPILLNTYYPPNAPTARRCYEIGRKVACIIENSKSDMRIAVAASGGLSHFVVDEDLDRKVLEAIKNKDDKTLKGLSRNQLNSGSSEILNWIMVAGMSEKLKNDWSEYYPGRRTPAGTGTGMGFATWS